MGFAADMDAVKREESLCLCWKLNPDLSIIYPRVWSPHILKTQKNSSLCTITSSTAHLLSLFVRQNIFQVLYFYHTSEVYVILSKYNITCHKCTNRWSSYCNLHMQFCVCVLLHLYWIVFMYVPCILYSLLSRPTNTQHIFINNVLYIV